MRLFLISFFALFLLLVSVVFFYALPKAETRIIGILDEAGFKNSQIENIKISPSGFFIQNIIAPNLRIKNMSATLYWPTYFFDQKIDNITISELTLDTHFDLENRNLIQEISSKIKIPDFKTTPDIDIEELKIEIGDDTYLTGTVNKKSHQMIAELNSDNNRLELKSKWELKKEFNTENYKLYADIQNLSTQNKYLTLNRASGWMAFEMNEEQTLNAQLEAGSGSLFKAPLNDINILIGKDDKYQSLLFRSSASGFPDITLNTDIEWSNEFDINLFTAYLSFPSSATLQNYLSANNLINNDSLQKIGLNQSEATIQYLPERRFADGPYPLEIKTIENGLEKLSGTILIYPENYDVRGTLTGSEKIIAFLNKAMPINNLKISEETIRLEGNLTH
jgi:hypothetical protein